MNAQEGKLIRGRIRQALQSVAGGDVRPALKDFLARERKRLRHFHQSGIGGFDCCRLHARLIDTLVDELLPRALREAGGSAAEQAQIAAVALGGYGREELAIHSDIDLMLLYADGMPKDRLEAAASWLFMTLRDIGLDLAHSARPAGELVRHMQDDHEIASAVLEGRVVRGSDELTDALTRVKREFAAVHGDTFCYAKVEEARARWRMHGDSPLIMQPNIKESAGGLRDANLAMWLTMATEHLYTWKEIGALGPYPAADVFPAINAVDYLLRMRNAMHFAAARRNDVLDGETQLEVARALGFASDAALLDYEKCMQAYYEAASLTNGLARAAIERWQDRRRPDRASVRRQPVTPWLVEMDRRVYLSRDEFIRFPRRPIELLAVFTEAHARGFDVPPSTCHRLRLHAGLIDDHFRGDPEMAQGFKSILASAGPVGSILRAMRDSGVLGEYLPEFGALQYRVQHDPYHQYTIDEHILRAVDELDAIVSSAAPEDAERQALLREYGSPLPLRLALLLHDIGKATGGAHEESTIAMAPQVARRLHCTPEELAELMFLIREHDLPGTAAQERNWNHPEFLRQTAAQVGTRRRWIGLYLTAYCDIKAVGKRVFNKYKDAELAGVFHAVLAAMDAGAGAAPVQDLKTVLKGVFTLEPDRRDFEQLAAVMPPRYFAEVSAEEAVIHVGLMQEFRRAKAAVFIQPRDAYADIWVAGTDMPARFSEIVGIVSGAGFNIVSAAAYTGKDGMILDKFRVEIEVDGRKAGRRSWFSLKQQLEDMLTGRKSAAEIIRNLQNRVRPLRPPDGVHRPTRVQISNKIAAEYTVIDITTRDRVGVLYAITQCLAEHHADIQYARIATRGSVVTDVFYVRRHSLHKEPEALAAELAKRLDELP